MINAGDNIKTERSNWKFSGETVKEFDTHVEKSVPLYNEGHTLICNISDFFVKNDSAIYEVGCSTGSLTFKLAEHNKNKPSAKFFGIDIEEDMIAAAEQKRSSFEDLNVEFIADTIANVNLEKSDMIVCYYTMQFIRPSDRQIIIDKIYENLNWGGALLMFEKTRGADARFQDILTALYTDYKLRKGYTPDAIVAKSLSLRGVMEPFSTKGNIDMLERSGFKDINIIQKYICFEGFLAIK
jgi:tRNA (cmo5U34)-methyltransferase